jgi:hypothetical protein
MAELKESAETAVAQTNWNSSAVLLGQTFTPESGAYVIDRIEVGGTDGLSGYSWEDALVSLYMGVTDSDTLDCTILYAQAVSLQSSDSGWNTFDLSSLDIYVTETNKCFFYIDRKNPGVGQQVIVTYGDLTEYDRGSHTFSTDGAVTWTVDTQKHLRFRVYGTDVGTGETTVVPVVPIDW